MTTTWSLEDSPSLAGKVAVVTGANSGLGYETARALRAKGARVVMACRNVTKADDAASKMVSTGPGLAPLVVRVDLEDLDSVRAAIDEITSNTEQIDLLVNNAGVMALRGPDGPERQLWANHLGHVALTSGLLSGLEATGGRIVVISSLVHRKGRLAADAPLEIDDQRPATAYGSTKLMNLHFCFEGDRRLRAARSAASIRAAHPGWSRSELARNGPARDTNKVLDRLAGFYGAHLGPRTERGALPALRAALDSAIPPGGYVGPGGPFELWGDPVPVKASAQATDAALASAVFDASLEAVGATWPGSPGR